MLAGTHVYIVLVLVAAVSSFIIYPSGAFKTSLTTFQIIVTNRPYSMLPQSCQLCETLCICSTLSIMVYLNSPGELCHCCMVLTLFGVCDPKGLCMNVLVYVY